MNRHRAIAAASCLLVALVLASTPALSGSRDIFVSRESVLNGTEVPQGKYQLSWKKNGSDDTVKISLYKGINLVASAEGRIVENEDEREGDSVVYKINDDGTREIVGVKFGGKTRAIEIES